MKPENLTGRNKRTGREKNRVNVEISPLLPAARTVDGWTTLSVVEIDIQLQDEELD